jgi:hypothetical protein
MIISFAQRREGYTYYGIHILLLSGSLNKLNGTSSKELEFTLYLPRYVYDMFTNIAC